MEVNGIPVFDYIRDLYDALPPRDRGLLQHALFVGIVMDPLKIDYGPGDFLIRNLIGIDPAKEGLSIGAPLREGQTLQFHLRDSRTSSEDLSALLSRYTGEGHPERLKGALLFSCLGRGKHLYGKPNHDTGSFRQALGDIPVGGFFCNGEIGPVGETTFLHGYTSSFGLFSDPRP